MENNSLKSDQPNLEDLISLKEAASLSGLSHDHLRRLAGRGDLWAKKIGRDLQNNKMGLIAFWCPLVVLQ